MRISIWGLGFKIKLPKFNPTHSELTNRYEISNYSRHLLPAKLLFSLV